MLRLAANLLGFTVLVALVYWALFGRGAWIARQYGGWQDAVIVWGDSRTYRGLDVAKMSRRLGRPVISYARNGAGVYDFLVFVDGAPDDCHAIVGVSFATLLRTERRDYHRSGLSFWALSMLARSGWPRRKLLEIFLNNRGGGVSPAHTAASAHRVRRRPRQSRRRLARYRGFARHIEPEPRYLRRLDLLRRGVEALLAKGCEVVVVDPPVAGRLRVLREQSIYRDYLTVFNSLPVGVIAPAFAEVRENIFFNLSHLNARGRGLLTEHLLERLPPSWSRRR